MATDGDHDAVPDRLVSPVVPRGNDGLAIQEYESLDLDTVTPTTTQVMSRQATMNIGTIGHVAHGKSTVVQSVSGVKTTKYKREAVMNITIHLGYANAKIYRARGVAEPDCYFSKPSNTPDKTVCPKTGAPADLIRHVSFVDCPGHDVLMATMLNGAAIMDAALLLVAANEPFPQPQTKEHLSAVEIMQLNKIIVLQNKIDLVKEPDAMMQFEMIRGYLRRTASAEVKDAPILPISAIHNLNTDVLLNYICHLPVPTRNLKAPVRMIIVRSFDVNMPGEDITTLKGGVAGGSVTQGVIRLNQEIEVRPGIIRRDDTVTCGVSVQPIYTTAASLVAEKTPLKYAIPGGLIAVGTKMDPTLTRQNKLVGQTLGDRGSLPEVLCQIDIQFFMLTELVGVKVHGKAAKPTKLTANEQLQVNIGTLTTGAVVERTRASMAQLRLMMPVCAAAGDKLTLSRMIDKHWRLVGWGSIRRGVQAEVRFYE